MPATLARAEARPPAPVCLYLSTTVGSLLALRADGCRWPLGEVGGETFTFCGLPRLSGASYCEAHKALARERVR